MTTLRNWPGVCFPKDCGRNVYVLTDCLFSLHILCFSDTSGRTPARQSFFLWSVHSYTYVKPAFVYVGVEFFTGNVSNKSQDISFTYGN